MAQIMFGATCFECGLIELDDGCFSSLRGIGMWGKCFVLIFHMCLGVSGFRLFKNRLSSLSVAESCGGDLKETLSISRSV